MVELLLGQIIKILEEMPAKIAQENLKIQEKVASENSAYLLEQLESFWEEIEERIADEKENTQSDYHKEWIKKILEKGN